MRCAAHLLRCFKLLVFRASDCKYIIITVYCRDTLRTKSVIELGALRDASNWWYGCIFTIVWLLRL